MGAVWIVARRDLRRRWATLILIGLMGGLAGAVAAGALTVARRTATAYPRLEEAARLGDALAIVNAGEPGVQAVTSLDNVEASAVSQLWIGAVRDDEVNYVGITSADWSAPLYRPVLVEGRLPSPDAPEEVLLNEQLPFADVSVGDRLDLDLLSPFQYGEFPQRRPPRGPEVTIEVVGTYRLPGLPGVVPPFVAGPAWGRSHQEWAVTHVVLLDLVDPSATGELVRDLQDVERTVPRIENREEFPVVEPSLLEPQRESVATSTSILVGGLVAFAAVTLLAGGFAVAQALVRMHSLGADDQAVEAAVGMTPAERLGVRAIGLVPPVVITAILTVGGAVAGGWFEPVGADRNYEPLPGVRPNLVILGVAAVAAGGSVAAIGLVSAWRSGRLRRRPQPQPTSALVGRLARIGAGPVGITGVRLALEPGRGRTAVPTRAALVSATVGIAGLIAVTVFGAGIHGLVGDPARWGGNADVRIAAGVPPRRLARSGIDGIAASALSDVGQILSGDHIVPVEAVHPPSSPLGWTITDGRAPERAGEVAIGTRTARRLDLDVGGALVVTDRMSEDHRFTVVGVGLGATLLSGQLGGSVLMWPADVGEVALSETIGQTYVGLDPDVDQEATARALARRLEVSPRELPAEITNLDRLGRLPAILGVFLALIGLLAIGNALVLATRRRRRDFAVLRSMGFRSRDAGRAVIVMAATIVVIGLVVGVPLGAALGAVLWRAIEYRSAVASVAILPWGSVALLSVAAFVAVVALAILPARRVARLRPAEALRSE